MRVYSFVVAHVHVCSVLFVPFRCFRWLAFGRLRLLLVFLQGSFFFFASSVIFRFCVLLAAQEASCLFWYSMYCTIPLFLCVPMESVAQVNATPHFKSVAWAFSNQGGAFACLIGEPRAEDYPTRCTNKRGYLWVLFVMLGFPLYFYYCCVLFKRAGAFWTLLLQSLARPISAVAFAIPNIVGQENYAPFTGYTAASFVVILSGVVLRGMPKDPRHARAYQPIANTEESISLSDVLLPDSPTVEDAEKSKLVETSRTESPNGSTSRLSETGELSALVVTETSV
eukprot:m.190003 g.190003  ORF g.190003 m.190003 type:complete len:283 (-) comp53621_c0_seq1:74-922(-)